MATIKAQLKLSSSSVGSNLLKLAVATNISLLDDGNRAGVGQTLVDTIIPTELGGLVRRMVYIKNIDPTNFLKIQTGVPDVYQELYPGEFTIMFVAAGGDVDVLADTAPAKMEGAFYDVTS